MTASNAPLTIEDLEDVRLDHFMFQIIIYVAAACMMFVIFNLLILSTNKLFVYQYQILIALNITDAILISSIFLEGLTRKQLYSNVLETKTKSVVNSRDCIELWNVVQVFGDFSMPLIELTMGIERFAAVTFPSFYRNKYKQTTFTLIVLSFLFAGAATVIPAGISILWPRPNVKYLCGRKAAFGTPLGILDYAFNVIIITTALALNVATCVKATTIHQSRVSMRKIKCYTFVAFVSMILISIPNLLSIVSATFLYVPHVFSTPAPILACVNGALQFFINFSLNIEFRWCCFDVISMGKYKRPTVATIGTKSTTVHVVVATTHF